MLDIVSYIKHKKQLNVGEYMVSIPYIHLVWILCIGRTCPGRFIFAPLRIVSEAKTQDVSLPGQDKSIRMKDGKK